MKIIDLFAGAGGLSCGLSMAGFSVVAANEVDDWAADTFQLNHPGVPVNRGAISEMADLSVIYGGKVDGVVGGPPCQGFSLAGDRDAKDPRNSLVMDFIRAVRHWEPRFFIMENVTGLLSAKTQSGESVVSIIMSEFRRIGYDADFKVLNAADFGVPQSRRRVIIIGFKKGLGINPKSAYPVPAGEKQVSAWDAISDLPQIESGEGSERQEYHSPPQNDFQTWARQNSAGVFNHIAMRHTDRLIERFKVIKAGQSVADVSEEHSALKRGNPKIKSGKVFGQNNMRVFASLPSPTVAASFQSNFIHPYLNRNFTAREGARLQSFPDTYIFTGKRTKMSWEKGLSQYQQIGNAVPPLLAEAVGRQIIKILCK